MMLARKMVNQQLSIVHFIIYHVRTDIWRNLLFSELELSNAGNEYQNKSMEYGFSDETTSASSINTGETANDMLDINLSSIKFTLL